MKKGFTLTELLGVIVIIATLMLVTIPIITKQIKEGKEKAHNTEINSIKQSLKLWSNDKNIKNGETIYLTLSQLKKEGLVANDFYDTLNKDYYANDMLLTITNVDDIINYNIVNEGNRKADYVVIPKININGNIITHVELKETYSDLGATAKDSDGNTLNNLYKVMDPNFNSEVVGSYYVKYYVEFDGNYNEAYRTLIVSDTTKPIINFDGDLNISLSEIDTYNFKNGVVVTDNSTTTLEVETNFTHLAGTYSITYKATDAYGNVSTLNRKVIVH